jgi:hypothetical protein
VKRPREAKTGGKSGTETPGAAIASQQKGERLEMVSGEVVKRLDAAIAAIASLLRGK